RGLVDSAGALVADDVADVRGRVAGDPGQLQVAVVGVRPVGRHLDVGLAYADGREGHQTLAYARALHGVHRALRVVVDARRGRGVRAGVGVVVVEGVREVLGRVRCPGHRSLALVGEGPAGVVRPVSCV